jgi:anti-sigma factor RsiW
MICSESREYLFAFLDNELDTALSIEFQHHLERCADCAREVEIERAVRGSLGRRLLEVPADFSFDESNLAMALEASSRVERGRGRTNRKRLLATGVAAVLLLGGIVISVKSPEIASTHSDARTADLLVADFDHFLKKGQPLQIRSQDPNAVSAWFGEQVKFEVLLPKESGGHCLLIGGRKCRIGGREAAFTMYKMEETPVSLVIVAAHPDDSDGMTLVSSGGRNHWVDRCQGHTIVAQRRGDLLYAAISTLPVSQLLHLLESNQS